MTYKKRLILPLEAVRQDDTGLVGGKAAALGFLYAEGFPTPNGLCVTTDAFRLALADYQTEINAIQSASQHKQRTSTRRAERLTRLLADLTVPAAVVSELQIWLPKLSAGTPDSTLQLAVRSSAVSEDGVRVSFAGQYATTLGVAGLDTIQTAILTCWRSFFSASALAARATHALNDDRDAMAVLIQPFIKADCAGVCFSVDPVQHHRDCMVINAAWGLGAGVVDGTVTTDTFWLRRPDLSLERRQVAEKTTKVLVDGAGDLRHAPVSKERQRAACLPPDWLERIAQFGMAAELLFGGPQDVEWAIEDSQLWVLQSRPISSLPTTLQQKQVFPVAWPNDDDRRGLWQREENGQPGTILLPLEQDHLALVAATREESCRLLGVEQNRRYLFFNGHAYFRRIPVPWTKAERKIRRTAVLDLRARLQAEGRTTWDHWGPEIVKATERLRAFAHDTADGSALADHLAETIAVRQRHYMLHPVFTFTPSPSYFDAFVAVTGATRKDADDSAQGVAYRLLGADETPLSQLVDQLYALARVAQHEEDVAALVAQGPPDLLLQLSTLPQAVDFLDQLEQFLEIFGERTGHGWGSETSLRKPTWRERPEDVLSMVRFYLNPGVEPPARARQRAQAELAAQVDAICSACNDAEAVMEFRRQWAYARTSLSVLETHNHYIDQMSTGQLRHAVISAGRWLAARSVLRAAEDVLWLRLDEILMALRSPSPAPLTETAAARQTQHAAWSQLNAPPILGLPNNLLSPRPPLQDDVTVDGVSEDSQSASSSLTGQGASAGKAQGRARCVSDSINLSDLAPGDVLVAHNVGPAWTPIFPILAGLVLESGALGQHAAATAREYGIPAIINVRNARQQIRDGAWLVLDGAAGMVEIRPHPSDSSAR